MNTNGAAAAKATPVYPSPPYIYVPYEQKFDGTEHPELASE